MVRKTSPLVQVSRSPSPQRVFINNKLVQNSLAMSKKAPVIHHRYESAVGTFRPNKSSASIHSQAGTDLVIREQPSMQSLRATY